MGLWVELQNGYFDQYGLVTPSQNSPYSSDNGLLYSSQAYILLKRHGEMKPEIESWFKRVVKSCEIEPGLFQRLPLKHGKTRQQGPDDYIGLCAASQEIAERVWTYGKKHGFSYNNVEPGKWTLRSFIGRQPPFLAHVRRRTKRSIGFLYRLSEYVSAGLTAKEPMGKTSNRLLQQMIVDSIVDVERVPKSKITIAMMTDWNRHFGPLYYEGSINGPVTIYFGKEHPFVNYWY